VGPQARAHPQAAPAASAAQEPNVALDALPDLGEQQAVVALQPGVGGVLVLALLDLAQERRRRAVRVDDDAVLITAEHRLIELVQQSL
jgi:hypothetical protein